MRLSSSVTKSCCTRKPPSEGVVSFAPSAALVDSLSSVRPPGAAALYTAMSCSPNDAKRFSSPLSGAGFASGFSTPLSSGCIDSIFSALLMLSSHERISVSNLSISFCSSSERKRSSASALFSTAIAFSLASSLFAFISNTFLISISFLLKDF